MKSYHNEKVSVPSLIGHTFRSHEIRLELGLEFGLRFRSDGLNPQNYRKQRAITCPTRAVTMLACVWHSWELLSVVHGRLARKPIDRIGLHDDDDDGELLMLT